jgi:uncharacterized protein (TIGR02145 family)
VEQFRKQVGFMNKIRQHKPFSLFILFILLLWAGCGDEVSSSGEISSSSEDVSSEEVVSSEESVSSDENQSSQQISSEEGDVSSSESESSSDGSSSESDVSSGESSSEAASSSEIEISSEEEISSQEEVSSSAAPCTDISLADDEMCDVRDGQVYKITVIGEQVVMAQNLNYESTSGSYCFNDEAANCETYGRLYQWNTAMGATFLNPAQSTNENPSGVRGVCPIGWHLPSFSEWEQLGEFIAEDSGLNAYEDSTWMQIGQVMKAESALWQNELPDADDYGFSALPGGYRIASAVDSFRDEGVSFKVWTSTVYASTMVWSWALTAGYDTFGHPTQDLAHALSVRCFQNPE